MGTVVAVLLILLFILLVVVLIDVSKRVIQKKQPRLAYENRYENIDIFDLPSGIEKISKMQMKEIPPKIFAVFKALDYKNERNDSKEHTWHSWQVGLLLNVYKKGLEFYIPSPEELITSEIVNLSDINLKNRMDLILKRYKKEVPIFQDKDTLCKDIRWSGEDVAVIFCFLHRYKYFPKG